MNSASPTIRAATLFWSTAVAAGVVETLIAVMTAVGAATRNTAVPVAA